MTRHIPIVAAVSPRQSRQNGGADATFAPTYCGECAGDGVILESRRIAGEAFDADWCAVPCHVCDGTGKGDWTPEPPAPRKSSAEIEANYRDACRQIDAAFNPILGLQTVTHLGLKGIGA